MQNLNFFYYGFLYLMAFPQTLFKQFSFEQQIYRHIHHVGMYDDVYDYLIPHYPVYMHFDLIQLQIN